MAKLKNVLSCKSLLTPLWNTRVRISRALDIPIASLPRPPQKGADPGNADRQGDLAQLTLPRTQTRSQFSNFKEGFSLVFQAPRFKQLTQKGNDLDSHLLHWFCEQKGPGVDQALWMRMVTHQLVGPIRSAEISHENKDSWFHPVTDGATNKSAKTVTSEHQLLVLCDPAETREWLTSQSQVQNPNVVRGGERRRKDGFKLSSLTGHMFSLSRRALMTKTQL